MRLVAHLVLMLAGCHAVMPLRALPSAEDAAVVRDGAPVVDRSSADRAVQPQPDKDVPTHAMKPVWNAHFAGAGSDEPDALVVDGTGRVYVTGLFQDGLTLGAKTAGTTAPAALFVALLDQNGKAVELYQAQGTSKRSQGDDLVLDGQNRLHLVGNFSTSMFFGSTLVTGDTGDIYHAVFTADVQPKTAQKFSGGDYEWASALARDDADNIYLAGQFKTTIALASTHTSVGNRDIVVASLDATHAPRWSKAIGTKQSDGARAMAVARDGNVYVAGAVYGPGPLWLEKTDLQVPSFPGGQDILLLSLTSDGNIRWTKVLGGSGTDAGEALAVDQAGNVYLAGSCAGTVDLGGGAVTGPGGKDIFVAVFGSDGTHRWSKVLGGSNDEEVGGLALLPDGVLALAGQFETSTTLGGRVLTSPSPDQHAFVAKLAASDGAHLWSDRYGGGNEDVTDLAADAAGNLYVTGEFFDAFDAGAGVPSLANTESEFSDGFLLKLAPE